MFSEEPLRCLPCLTTYKAALIGDGVDPASAPYPQAAATLAPLGVQVPGGMMAVALPVCLEHLPEPGPSSGLVLGGT